MSQYSGIFFALIALAGWGFGDFFIQKTTRIIGSSKALFFIGLTGCVGLFPFIVRDLAYLRMNDFVLLLVVTVIFIFTALVNFEALRQGKIAIVEPIIGLELPITVGLSMVLLHENLSLLQLLLMVTVFIGIVLAITAHHTHLHYHKRIFEKGVIWAAAAAVGMALSNLMVGVSSQSISPLMTIWVTHAVLAFVCGTHLFYNNEFKSLVGDLKKHPWPIVGQSIFDNVAWLAFGMATTLIPVAIAITISESYIALAVMLGLLVSHEKLKKHQLAGVGLAVLGVVMLAYFS